MVMPEHNYRSSANSYSYADYLLFPKDERWEIINGAPYNMTPAPSTIHQRVVTQLSRHFANYLDGKTCEVFSAPFDVRLLADGKKNEDIQNVVQPDVTVVCDPDKLDDHGCNGSPDLIIEVLSPSTAGKDKKDKLKLYRKAQVQEYWIVDPIYELVEVYRFQDNPFTEPALYEKEDEVRVGIFEDFTLDLKLIFNS